jgi:hypothetical protein
MLKNRDGISNTNLSKNELRHSYRKAVEKLSSVSEGTAARGIRWNTIRKLKRLISHQDELIYYKYHQIIGLFTTQFFMQWSLNIQNIQLKVNSLESELEKSAVVVSKNKKKNANNSKMRSATLKIIEELKRHILYLNSIHFSEHVSKDIGDSISNQSDELDAKARFERIFKALNEFKKSHLAEGNDLIERLVDLIEQLLSGSYRYTYCYIKGTEFKNVELAFTRASLHDSIVKNLSPEEKKELIVFNPNDKSGIAKTEFNKYELYYMEFLHELQNKLNTRERKSNKDVVGFTTDLNKIKNVLSGELFEFINACQDAWKAKRNISKNNIWTEVDKRFEKSKFNGNGGVYLFLTRLLLVIYHDSLPEVMISSSDVSLKMNYLIKIVDNKRRNMANNKAPEGQGNDDLSIALELIADNAFVKALTDDKIFSRKYLLIYKFQMYKMLQALANLDEGFERLLHDIKYTNIKKARRNTGDLKDLVRYKLSAKDFDAMANKYKNYESNYTENYEFMHSENPLISETKSIPAMVMKIQEHGKFYRDSLKIHHQMVVIKHLLEEGVVHCEKWFKGLDACSTDNNPIVEPNPTGNQTDQSGKNKTSDDETNASISEEMPGIDAKSCYNESYSPCEIEVSAIVEHFYKIKKAMDKISKIVEDQRKQGFYNEPYRSATVVMPLGYLGGMSKKLWESERFRFELLLSGFKKYEHDPKVKENSERAKENLKLLWHYYNLRYCNLHDPEIEKILKPKDKIETQIFEIAKRDISKSLGTSVLEIMKAFTLRG